MAALQEREDLEQKLDDFLEDHRSFLDEQTTFQLLASHGHEHALLRFATHCVDDSSPQKFERVTAHHARRRDWREVLAVLDHAPFGKAAALFYKYSLQLLEHIPMETVEVRQEGRNAGRKERGQKGE